MYIDKRIDIDNRRWFANDGTRNSLRRLVIKGCNLRGIYPSEISFKYPITAITGQNGSGKSTLLALVACAFHNPDDSFRPLGKQEPQKHYYTYKDFFVFASDERGLTQTIKIESNYLSNNPLTGESFFKIDIRKKDVNGKWNNYDTRPKRKVSFLGINRILPPSESPTYKNYKNYFNDQSLTDVQQQELKQYMSDIFGKRYANIKMYTHNKYQLFAVDREISYSGFNMGAGENAVLSLLYEIIRAGEGALLVIDEIELGLHIKAQAALIDVLKQLCKKYKSQIVCSTHSSHILNELPPDARILVQSTATTTSIVPEISPEFAFGVMAGHDLPELSIFVEDDKAKFFVEEILSPQLLHRVCINIIGSADCSIPRQMEARFREGNINFCSIMDGDKRTAKDSIIRKIVSSLADNHSMNDDDKKNIFDQRMNYLPGNVNPEKHLLQQILMLNNMDTEFQHWGYSDAEIRGFSNEGINAGTHNEFYTLSQRLGRDETSVYRDVVRVYAKHNQTEILSFNEFITNLLN